MKNIVITGYTSEISKSLIKTISKKKNIRILKCGRKKSGDYVVDFSSYSSTRNFIAWLGEIKPDYIFLNHGILPGKKISAYSDDLIDETLKINLASYCLIIDFLPNLPNTRTVITSSISGKAGSYDSLYAATKSGLDVLIKCTVKLLSSKSRINAISPGIIKDAKMTRIRTDHQVLKNKISSTPTKKLTTAKDVALLVHYLLFENENINGENININGGIFTR